MIYTSCDTFIAQATDGTQLFAKNSDRDPNEAHHIIYAARQDFKEVKFLVNISFNLRKNILCAALCS
jgi:dipeptidase